MMTKSLKENQAVIEQKYTSQLLKLEEKRPNPTIFYEQFPAASHNVCNVCLISLDNKDYFTHINSIQHKDNAENKWRKEYTEISCILQEMQNKRREEQKFCSDSTLEKLE